VRTLQVLNVPVC